MNILIFPEYAYPASHVVVNTVYETLLPARGHAVHMIRPMAGVSQPQAVDASWVGGTLVVYPAKEPVGLLGNALAVVRRRYWLRQAVEKFDGVPLDAVLVRNDLPSAIVGMRLAQRRGIPFIYQLSSPDAEFRVRLGRRSGGFRGGIHRLRGHADLTMRRWVMRQASAVLAISDAMGEYLVATDGLDARRVFSFPMGVRGFTPQPEATSNVRRDLGLPSGRTMVYSGVIDPVRQPVWMLDVFDRVRAKVPDAVFLVLTYQKPDDSRRQAFEAEARRRGAAIKVVGPLSNSDVLTHLRCADVMFSPMPPMPEHNVSSPTKSIEAMSAGLPVVGSAEILEHRTVFAQSGGGIAVPWDQQAFADAIVSLLRDPAAAQAMGERGRRWVLEHRTYERLTDYLERIIANAGSVTALAALPHQVESDRVG